MGIYITARNMLNTMIQDILSNDNIMKYVVYDDVKIDPLTKPSISNPIDYLYNPQNPESLNYRVFQIPKIPNDTENQKTVIVGRVIKTHKIDDNHIYKNYTICFDIVSHIDLWAITGGKIRPLEIAEEINEIYSQYSTTNSIKKVFALDDSYIEYNSRFHGYRIIYSATDFTKDMCG